MSSPKLTAHVPGDEQLSEFQNATFDEQGDIAISIATTVSISDIVLSQGVAAAADYVRAVFSAVTYSYPELSFEIQLGRK